MKYVKLENNMLEYAPKNKGEILNYDLDVDLMLADGYKPYYPLEEYPDTNRRYHVEYKEAANKISEVIVYEETQKEANKRELEQETNRVTGLTMTSLDLINYLKKEGLSLEEITDFLDKNLELKTQLTYCQYCYCGVVTQLCPLTISNLEVTEEMVIGWFEDKNSST